jgi:hypothetical protein
MFEDQFINRLPEDPIPAVIVICKEFLAFHAANENAFSHYKGYIEALGFIEVYAEANNLEMSFPQIDEKREQNIVKIEKFFMETCRLFERKYQQSNLEDIKKKFASKLKPENVYTADDNEVIMLKKQLIALRNEIERNSPLDEDYKFRIIRKVDKILSISYKSMTDLNPFWGLIGERGIIAGKLGPEEKKIPELINLLVDTIWKIQLRSENMPANTPR